MTLEPTRYPLQALSAYLLPEWSTYRIGQFFGPDLKRSVGAFELLDYLDRLSSKGWEFEATCTAQGWYVTLLRSP